MAQFYLDKRYYAGKPARWVSFESTPDLEETKKDIYGKCVPCISNLYEQLQAGKAEIYLGAAYTCWKVVAVLANDDECVQVLAEFEKDFLGDQKIKGRFGSGDVQASTRVIVFSVPGEKEINFRGQARGNLSSEHGEREGEAPAVLPMEGATRAPAIAKLFQEVRNCSRRVNPGAEVSFHRGCAELYHELFGDWKSWKQIETIKQPEAVKEVLARIRRMLFWERSE